MARSLADGRLPAAGRIAVFAEPALFDAACAAAGLRPLPRWNAEGGFPAPDTVAGPGRAPAVLVPVTPAPVPTDFALGRPSAFTGRVAAACVERAAGAALAGWVDALVTAPLAKSARAAAGVPFPGHTEFLASLAGGARVAMMFVAGSLRLTLATIHVPLADVPRLVTPELLLETMRLTREALARHLALANPKLAVLGLNPHAGEGGLFGREEIENVAPAIAAARARDWAVDGPYPADSYFFRRAGDYDATIALYHDQGLIPVKLLSAGKAVNVTLGLPFLRTSVDHGTAFDRAGRGTADADSLVAAARLAAEWTRPASGSLAGAPPP